MSGQLGELVISLSADMARFREDMGKAAKTTQTTMQQMQSTVDSGVKGLQNTFALVGKSMAAITAVAAGGAAFKDMIDSTKAWSGETMKLSKVMGLTVAEASAYNAALRIAGVDQDTATTATAKLTKTLATNEDAFKRHGIAVRDASGKILPMTQVITNTFEALGKLETGASRNSAAMELFGRSWVQLQSMAKVTNPLLAEAKQLSDDLGLTLDGRTTEAVKKYSQEMNKLKLVHEGFKVMVGREVLGPLVELEKQITRILTKDHALRDTIAFMAHPIDFTRKQWSYFEHPGERYPMPERPSAKAGAEYDPTKATEETARQAERERAVKAAEAESERIRVAYNHGVQGFNSLVDALRVADPTLTETQRRIMAINEEVAKLGKEHPEQRVDAERVGGKIVSIITTVENAKKEAEEYERLLTEIKVLESEIGFGDARSKFGLATPKRPNYDFSGKPLPGGKFSLNGPPKSSFFGGGQGSDPEPLSKADLLGLKYGQQGQFDGMVNKYRGMFDQIKAIEETFGKGSEAANAAMWGARADMARDGMNMITGVLLRGNKEQFEAGKALASVMAVVDGALAIQKALASAPPPYNFIAAGLVGAATAIQISTIQSQHYDGARANGGPVESGKTYLVGERGPELMTVGASGYVTPNERIGGGSVSVTNYNDFRHADPATEQRLTAQLKASEERTKASILKDMNRGGKFAYASGRMG